MNRYRYKTIEEIEALPEYDSLMESIQNYLLGQATFTDVYEHYEWYVRAHLECEEVVESYYNDYFADFVDVKAIPFGDKKNLLKYIYDACSDGEDVGCSFEQIWKGYKNSSPRFLENLSSINFIEYQKIIANKLINESR